MKKYKVYFLDTEVAEFKILYNAIVYIYQRLDNDKELLRESFSIYELLEVE